MLAPILANSGATEAPRAASVKTVKVLSILIAFCFGGFVIVWQRTTELQAELTGLRSAQRSVPDELFALTATSADSTSWCHQWPSTSVFGHICAIVADLNNSIGMLDDKLHMQVVHQNTASAAGRKDAKTLSATVQNSSSWVEALSEKVAEQRHFLSGTQWVVAQHNQVCDPVCKEKGLRCTESQWPTSGRTAKTAYKASGVDCHTIEASPTDIPLVDFQGDDTRPHRICWFSTKVYPSKACALQEKNGWQHLCPCRLR